MRLGLCLALCVDVCLCVLSCTCVNLCGIVCALVHCYTIVLVCVNALKFSDTICLSSCSTTINVALTAFYVCNYLTSVCEKG